VCSPKTKASDANTFQYFADNVGTFVVADIALKIICFGNLLLFYARQLMLLKDSFNSSPFGHLLKVALVANR
jgi:hypothetical protein